MKKQNSILYAFICTLVILSLSGFVSAACDNDGQCEFGESTSNCPRDCGTTAYCGDGSCNNGETCTSCVADCDTCPPPSGPVCGNGQCEFGETQTNCPRDCGSPVYCGDGSCNNGETCSTCVADCGACPPACTPHAYTACYGSGDNTDRYWYNSCGQREGIAQDCGDTGYTGNNFCSNNDVYRPYANKGCSNNVCYSNPSNKLQQDCGEDSYGNNFCSTNDLYRTFTDRGCSAGACFATDSNQLVQDCGDSGYAGNNFCSNNDVYRLYETKGCTNNACFSTPSNILQQDCGEDSNSSAFCSNNDVFRNSTDRGCNSGTCFAINTTPLIQDCGNSGFINNPFCQSDDLYQLYQNRSCSSGICNARNQTLLVDDCGEDSYGQLFCSNNDVYQLETERGCEEDACYIENNNNLIQDCGEDSNSSPFCSNNDVFRNLTDRGCSSGACFAVNTMPLVLDCGNNFTSNPYCSNNDVYRVFEIRGCNGGSCYFINNTNMTQDCGNSNYTGNNYCSNNDVYRVFTNRTCSSGTCLATNSSSLIQDCGEDSNGSPFCSNNDVFRNLTDRGCSSGACFAVNTTPLVQDCGDSGFGSAFCSNNDVYRSYTNRTCSSGACQSTNSTTLIEDCGEDTFSSDSDGGLNFFVLGMCLAGVDRGCNSGTCFANSGVGNGTDSCKDSCLSTTLKEFQTNGTFNCKYTLKNCNDFDNLSYDLSRNTCIWNDFDCGVGICRLIEQENVDCDDYDTQYYDYFVTSTNCTMDCQNIDCCDKQEITLCGNGIVDSEEECDDGNLVNGDGCSNTCQVTYQCSDSVDNDQDSLIDCQDPGCHTDNNPNNQGTCIPTIDDETDLSVCGNSIIESGEECDDGNLIETDGCASDCTITDPFGYCSANLDIIYIIDRSGSTEAIYDNATNMDILEYEKLLALKLVNLSRNDSSYSGVVSFATTALLNQVFSSNLDLTYDAINSINRLSPPPQRTNLGESIKLAQQEIEENARPSSIRLMIILADGAPNEYSDPPISCTTYPASPNDCTNYALLQANIAKQDGTQIFVLGMNPTSFSQDFFKLITNNASYYYNNPTLITIDEIYNNSVNQACGCYANNCSPNLYAPQAASLTLLSDTKSVINVNDVDSDGVIDSEDNIMGDYSEINTNLEYLKFVFKTPTGDIINPNDYDGVVHVIVETYDNNKLLEFDYNFTKLTKLYLENVTIVVNQNLSEGSLIVDGINIQDQGFKKMIYLNNINMNSKICIHDGPVQNIGDLSDKCVGENEVIINCPGTNGGYTCELYDNIFRINGLSHTAVKQLGAVCGDGFIDTNEECDGTNFGSQTCITKGFNLGALSCFDDCKLSTANCVNSPPSTGGGGSGGKSSGSSRSTSTMTNKPVQTNTSTTQKTEVTPKDNLVAQETTTEQTIETTINGDNGDEKEDLLTGKVVIEDKSRTNILLSAIALALLTVVLIGGYFLFLKEKR